MNLKKLYEEKDDKILKLEIEKTSSAKCMLTLKKI